MKKLYIVTGPPCAGKSTYCREHMGPLDIVFDYDEIANALCYGTDHSYKEHVAGLTLQMRKVFIHFINNALGIPGAVWIINTAAPRNIAAQVYGYEIEVVELKATRQECLARMMTDPARPDKKTWERAINKYFDDRQRDGYNSRGPLYSYEKGLEYT